MQGVAPSERDFDANGVRIHGAYWAGTNVGPPLVLLHGIWDSWRTFAPVAGELAAERAVYALDLRGHGGSDKPARGYRHADYAADILGVLARLPHEEVDLLGFSLGALIAICIAAEHPERVARLILEDPPLGVTIDDPRRRAWFEQLLELKQQPFAEVVDELSALNPNRDRATNEASARALIGTADGPFEAFLNGENAGVDFPALLSQVGAPTLVLRADPAVGGALPDAGKVQLLSALPAAQLIEFSDTGHLIHAERPADFVTAVRDFLAAR